MNTYLITGGAGFIGSHLVRGLLEAGHNVTVLDDLSTGKQENLPDSPQLKLSIGDICNGALLAEAMENCAGVFHLAAIASVTRSLEQWAETHRVNQSGAVMVFEQAAKQKIPVVYASSAAVYGDNPNLPLCETEAPSPLSPYGLDKLACEWQAGMGARCHALQSIGLRFFNVYGERQDPKSPYSGVISIFMDKVKQKQNLTIYGDGLQSRDFIYVGDVVTHLIAAMQKLHSGHSQPEILNVCTGIATTVKDLAMLLSDIGGEKVEIIHAPERFGDIRHSLGNSQKAEELLCLKATTNLKNGLERMF